MVDICIGVVLCSLLGGCFRYSFPVVSSDFSTSYVAALMLVAMWFAVCIFGICSSSARGIGWLHVSPSASVGRGVLL